MISTLVCTRIIAERPNVKSQDVFRCISLRAKGTREGSVNRHKKLKLNKFNRIEYVGIDIYATWYRFESLLESRILIQFTVHYTAYFSSLRST